MSESAITITSCQLELRQAQQGVFGLWCQRVIHHEVLVITFGISRVRSEGRSPEQRLGV
jgi:hypothetical protein